MNKKKIDRAKAFCIRWVVSSSMFIEVDKSTERCIECVCVAQSKRSLSDLLLVVPNTDVTEVLTATVVVGKIDETIVLCAVEDCSDEKGLASKLVDAAVDRSMSESHAPDQTGRRRQLELTRCRLNRRGQRSR